ncbi:MAG: phage baseplate assembly protein V [Acidobacteriaceae bacterium]
MTLFGKYRGNVTSNADPLGIGRLLVQIPDLPDLPSTWAMPCVPFAGQQAGLLAIPALGSHLWVEFERGLPDHPVWVGGFWSAAADLPPSPGPPGPQQITLRTPLGHTLTLDDQPGPAGGILLRSDAGALISITDLGITISNGKGAQITLSGPTVDINLGALSIT